MINIYWVTTYYVISLWSTGHVLFLDDMIKSTSCRYTYCYWLIDDKRDPFYV